MGFKFWLKMNKKNDKLKLQIILKAENKIAYALIYIFLSGNELLLILCHNILVRHRLTKSLKTSNVGIAKATPTYYTEKVEF